MTQKLLNHNKWIYLKLDKDNNTKISCPLCEYLATSIEDIESINKNNLCCECNLNFFHIYNNDSFENPDKELARNKMLFNILNNEKQNNET